jgi:hypothetical protein
MRTSEDPTTFSQTTLLLGDTCVYLIATLLGFASHETLETAAWKRLLATFVPFLAAWLALAGWSGIYSPGRPGSVVMVVKAVSATLFAAPMGAVLRGFWLQSPVIPVFVLVMALVTAGLMLLWRGILWILARRSL